MKASYLFKSVINFLVLVFPLLLVFPSCNQNTFHFIIENPNSQDQKNQVIVINRTQIEKRTDYLPDNKFLCVENGLNKLPAQFDDLDFDGRWDEIAILISLNANESKKLSIEIVDKNELSHFKPHTAIHFGVKPAKNKPAKPVDRFILFGNDLPWDDDYYPFQMDGPAWENDKVGFRLYFDGRNAKDIFAKSQPDLVLENVGLDSLGNPIDNYHVLENWGRDVLQVGNSLGAGGLAMLKNDSMHRLGIIRGAAQDVVDSTVFRLINTGPVRAIFSLTYNGWKVENEKVDLQEIISINSGEYSYHSRVTPLDSDKRITLVTGMSNLNNDNPLQVVETDSNLTLLTHDKQTYEKEYFMGMALSAEKRTGTGYNQATDSGPGVVSSYYISQPLQRNQEWKYTFYACCELTDPQFRNQEFFKNFIQKELEKKDIKIQF